MSRDPWDIQSYGKLLRRRTRIGLMFRGWRVFATVIGLFLVGVTVVTAGVAIRVGYREHMLADGAVTEATVVGKELERLETSDYYGHGNGQVHRYWHLEYRFQTPDGRTFTERAEVSPGLYRQVAEGGPLQIRYSRRDPEISKPVWKYDSKHPTLLASIGPTIAGVIAAGLLLGSWRVARKEEYLVANGRLVTGTVIERIPAKDHLPTRVRFRYKPHCAPACEGTAEAWTNQDPFWNHRPGDTLTVIYDPYQPHAGQALAPRLARLVRAPSEPAATKSDEPGL